MSEIELDHVKKSSVKKYLDSRQERFDIRIKTMKSSVAKFRRHPIDFTLHTSKGKWSNVKTSAKAFIRDLRRDPRLLAERLNLITDRRFKGHDIRSLSDEELLTCNISTRRSIASSATGVGISAVLVGTTLFVYFVPLCISAHQLVVSAINRARVKREVKRRRQENPKFEFLYQRVDQLLRPYLIGILVKAVLTTISLGIIGFENIFDAFSASEAAINTSPDTTSPSPGPDTPATATTGTVEVDYLSHTSLSSNSDGASNVDFHMDTRVHVETITNSNAGLTSGHDMEMHVDVGVDISGAGDITTSSAVHVTNNNLASAGDKASNFFSGEPLPTAETSVTHASAVLKTVDVPTRSVHFHDNNGFPDGYAAHQQPDMFTSLHVTATQEPISSFPSNTTSLGGQIPNSEPLHDGSRSKNEDGGSTGTELFKEHNPIVAEVDEACNRFLTGPGTQMAKGIIEGLTGSPLEATAMTLQVLLDLIHVHHVPLVNVLVAVILTGILTEIFQPVLHMAHLLIDDALDARFRRKLEFNTASTEESRSGAQSTNDTLR